MDQPFKKGIIDLPNKSKKGTWSKKYAERLEQAELMEQECIQIRSKIQTMKTKTIRNKYSLEVYEQVNEMVLFSSKMLLTLKDYDNTNNKQEETAALNRIRELPEDFNKTRKALEVIYSKTRKLNKPADYILDQDHHSHLANQTISFNWQFYAEILFLEKIMNELSN